jgi:uncharacterized protein
VSAFADASALVKLDADEEGAELVRAVEVLVVSRASRVEVPAALWRKNRLGQLEADAARVLAADFEADLFGTPDEQPRLVSVRLGDDVLDEAARLVAVHGLRAYDGVQLASALAARRADSQCALFAAFDRSLRSAAAAEGFALLPGS